MAVADIYDALVCERSYKKKWSHEEAVQEIVRNKNSALDPWVVDAFIAEQLAFKSIAMAFND
jgi:HD-GYP domain-containing protein (c-di-GMP phosphodiesterase class II)